MISQELEGRDMMQTHIDLEEEKKNSGFTQVYSKGWKRLRWLMEVKPTAAQLYSYIAENLDPDGGALVASQEVLAGAIGVSEITVRRLTKWLEDNSVIVRIRVGSGVYAYALDPEEVWTAVGTQSPALGYGRGTACPLHTFHPTVVHPHRGNE